MTKQTETIPTHAEMLGLMNLMIGEVGTCKVVAGSDAEKTFNTVLAIRNLIASLTPSKTAEELLNKLEKTVYIAWRDGDPLLLIQSALTSAELSGYERGRAEVNKLRDVIINVTNAAAIMYGEQDTTSANFLRMETENALRAIAPTPDNSKGGEK